MSRCVVFCNAAPISGTAPPKSELAMARPRATPGVSLAPFYLFPNSLSFTFEPGQHDENVRHILKMLRTVEHGKSPGVSSYTEYCTG